MRCHYVTDRGKKILIPGCMGVAVNQDINYCTCKPKRFETHESRILKLEKDNNSLKKELYNLKKSLKMYFV